MCLKIEQLKSYLDTKQNNFILINTNSKEEKNIFLINFIVKCVYEDNIKIGIINYSFRQSVLIKSLIKRKLQLNPLLKNELKTNKNGIVLKNIGNSNLYLSSSSSMNVKELIKRIEEIKEKEDVKIMIIDSVKNIIDYEEQKENLYKELQILSNKLNINIIKII